MRALFGQAPVVIISDRQEPAEVELAYNAACQGFLSTKLQPKFALEAIDFVMRGGLFFPPTMLGQVNVGTDQLRHHRDPLSDAQVTHSHDVANAHDVANVSYSDLCSSADMTAHTAHCQLMTQRQQQVLDRLRLGESNKEIARALSLTEGTVKIHIRQIMRKLGASNRTQAAVRTM
jgi:DNA-binding NarL/FixJ family response regulator